MRRGNVSAGSMTMDASTGKNALMVGDLCSGYGSSEVLHDVSLRIAERKIHAIIGKNGMGKSTLLKTVMGLVRATSGHVQMFGEAITKSAAYEIARRGVSYVAQEKALFTDLTVEENIMLSLPRGEEISAAFENIGALFPVIPGRRRQLAGTLSGGEQKMLLLARAIIARPRLLLIDEITEGLQPSVRTALAEGLLRYQQESGCAMLLVEQDLRFTFNLANEFSVMKMGRLSIPETTAGIDWRSAANEHLAI